MPRYDFRCEVCGETQIDVFRSCKEIEDPGTYPRCCGTTMPIHYAPKRHSVFPAFVTKNVDGKPLEITSLSQIRRIEKQNEHKKMCWEPGSWNSHYGDL